MPQMEQLLAIRDQGIALYKRYESWAAPIAKFLAAFLCFYQLSALSLGARKGVLALGLALFCALISAVTPLGVFYILAMAAASFYLTFASVELGLLAFLGLFMLLVFYVRLFPMESLIIPGMLLCWKLGVPYLIPLLAGLYAGIGGIVPVGIAAFLWYFAKLAPQLAALSPRADFTLLGMPEGVVEIFVMIYQGMMEKGEWIFVALVFIIGLLVVYAFCQLWKDYAKEAGLAAGAAVMLVLLVVLKLLGRNSMGILGMVLGSAVSLVLAEAVRFCDIVLDYQKSQTVQFSDDDFYYYVKVVPKKTLKRATPHREAPKKAVPKKAAPKRTGEQS